MMTTAQWPWRVKTNVFAHTSVAIFPTSICRALANCYVRQRGHWLNEIPLIRVPVTNVSPHVAFPVLHVFVETNKSLERVPMVCIDETTFILEEFQLRRCTFVIFWVNLRSPLFSTRGIFVEEVGLWVVWVWSILCTYSNACHQCLGSVLWAWCPVGSAKIPDPDWSHNQLFLISHSEWY